MIYEPEALVRNPTIISPFTKYFVTIGNQLTEEKDLLLRTQGLVEFAHRLWEMQFGDMDSDFSVVVDGAFWWLAYLYQRTNIDTQIDNPNNFILQNTTIGDH